MVKYPKDQEIEMVKIFRFRKQPHPGRNRTYMPLKDIAKFLNKSIAHVSKICKELKQPKVEKKSRAEEVSLTLNQHL